MLKPGGELWVSGKANPPQDGQLVLLDSAPLLQGFHVLQKAGVGLLEGKALLGVSANGLGQPHPQGCHLIGRQHAREHRGLLVNAISGGPRELS